MTRQTLEDIGELARQPRVDSIRCSTTAGSGHPASSMSAADVMAVLPAGISAATGSGRTTRPTTT
jgi:transketolase